MFTTAIIHIHTLILIRIHLLHILIHILIRPCMLFMVCIPIIILTLILIQLFIIHHNMDTLLTLLCHFMTMAHHHLQAILEYLIPIFILLPVSTMKLIRNLNHNYSSSNSNSNNNINIKMKF